MIAGVPMIAYKFTLAKAPTLNKDNMQDMSHAVDIVHHFGGGVYAKETRIPSGLILSQHIHKHDHLSILASGKAQVTVDGESKVIQGPACILIEAGRAHKVTSLSEVCWFCIHATEETDPLNIDHTLIEEK